MSFNATVVMAQVEYALAAAGASDRLVFAYVGEAITGTLESPPPSGLQTQMYVLSGILAV